ncbi:MAG TPA: YbjN domain-containing protein [Ktedonobacteraceae bacterium]|jgi:hypothetical protein|nr:YbjN domain-containing protein [Ktedonobacteraceae bacterium]
MADTFGIPELLDYLAQLGLRVARVDEEEEMVELAFHSTQGQWRMIVGFQQHEDARRLYFVVPHIFGITQRKRMECLEALLAVNYRITLGKFGMDLEDGEVRLEEAVPLAEDSITFEQFQLVFGTLVQTVVMYHSLIPRIVYGNASALEAVEGCEQEFQQEVANLQAESHETSPDEAKPVDEPGGELPDLDPNDILAEVTRMLEEKE